ncbi:MAG: choice-of-anchor D domain-containing protein [Bacteroidota bacterium]|nr:choice-of-anchor D domain-containing protein [Bacteroidota bacterium]
MKNFYFFTYLLLFALILGNQASAIEVVTDVKIGTNLNSSQFSQVVSCTNGNNFLVVWSGDQDGKDRIYYNFQDVASVSGVPVTTGALLSEIVIGKFNYAERPQVAYDASSNTAAVVWQESHVMLKDSVVMAVINTSTKLKTTQIVVASGSWNMSSTVSSNHNGTYLVVWYDATSQNISGRFYGTSGSPVGSAVVLGSVPSGYLLPYSIDIDYNSTDAQFLVSWADLSTNLFSRTIKTDGTLGTLNNYSTISGVINPAIAYNDLTNEFLLVYDDFAGNISGILTDNTGVKIGSPLTFGSIPGIQAKPDVRLNSDNHAYAISWHDPSLTAGIWFQEYSGTLVPTFTTAVKIDSQTATSYAPSIAYGGSEYWISWFGQSPALKDEMYLQRYESDYTQVNAKCKNVTISLNASGSYTLTVAEIDNGSTASSGIASMVLSKTVFTCNDIATNPNEVTLTVTGIDGNEESCTATVTVVDDVDPVAKAKAYTAELDATGNVTITPANVDDGSSDACGILSMALSKTDFTCSDIATNPNVVTLTVTDNHGNTNTATANVTVTTNNPSVAPTSISGTTTICSPNSTTLTAVGGTLGTGANYQWGTGAVVGTSPLVGETASTLTVSPANTTTYWVRIENATAPCFTNTDGVTQDVTVDQPSVAPTGATGTTTICVGGSTTLTVTGGSKGIGAVTEWFSGSCGGTLEFTGDSFTVSPGTTTTYLVRYSGDCNTTTCATVIVTVVTQEINVQGNSITIVDGAIAPSLTDQTDFGDVITGNNFVRTYTVQNTGTDNLTVSGITVTGGNAGMFTVGSLTPASPIAGGGSATFTVSFAPTSTGIKTTTVHIANNDCDETDYDFAIQGIGTCVTDPVVVNNNDAGLGSLRQAVLEACPGSTITFSGVASPIILTTGEIVINKNLTINGPGVNMLSVSGNNSSRVFNITSGVTVDINNLTITSGHASFGGGITNGGTLALNNIVFSGNNASAPSTFSTGGGLSNSGTANLTNVVFSNNTSTGGGGAVITGGTLGANAIFTNVVFSRNRTFQIGGAARGGAVINNGRPSTFINCTFYGNSSDERAGAMYNVNNTTVQIKNCIFWGNSAPTSSDIDNAFNGGLLPAITTSLFGVDPLFVNAADPDGGDNSWITGDDGLRLQIGSPANNTGTAAGSPATDILGVARLGNTDIGAYEFGCSAPTFTNCPGNQNVNSSVGSCSAVVNYNATATATDTPAPTLTYQFSGATTGSGSGTGSGSTFNVGVTTVTITATNLCGNPACSFTVSVVDNTPPSVTCKSTTVYLNSAGTASIVPADVYLTGSDNCGTVNMVSVYPSSFTCANLGSNTVTLTVNDGHGNTNTCTSTVTVVDNTPPSITCPANKTSASDAGLCTKTFTTDQIGLPSASDNCSYSISWSRSDAAPILTDPFQFGVTTITWTATDPAGLTASCSQTITIDKITTNTTVTVTPNSQQYSDLVEFKAAISPWNCAVGGNAGGDVTFYVGTQAMGAPVTIGSDGIATMVYPLVEIPSQPSNGQMAPGNHVVLADFNNTDPAFDVQDKTTLLSIIKEDALVEYVGGEFQATQSSTSSSANVVLRAVIKSVADAPGSSGDIRNACVTFEIGGITIGSLTPQLLNPADITTGVVVYNWTANIGTADYSTFDLRVKANCYFTGEDQTVITVYKPVGDFITGGGNIKPTLSSGVYASTAGQKTNFGFHVKFNKKGTSLQGGMNIIFRRQVGVETQLFQIKTNSMSSLGVNISDPKAKTGVFTSKANLKNLTTGESLGGNLQLQVKISDRGEPGANDDIAITLWDGKILLYSSNWTGLNTIPLLLSGGNLVVQSGFGLKSAEIVTGISEIPTSFEFGMYPNPTKGEVTLEITSSEIQNSEVIVRSITGSEVFRKEYKASEQIRFDLSKLVSGTYLVTLEIDGKFIVKKLILDKN